MCVSVYIYIYIYIRFLLYVYYVRIYAVKIIYGLDFIYIYNFSVFF